LPTEVIVVDDFLNFRAQIIAGENEQGIGKACCVFLCFYKSFEHFLDHNLLGTNLFRLFLAVTYAGKRLLTDKIECIMILSVFGYNFRHRRANLRGLNYALWSKSRFGSGTVYGAFFRYAVLRCYYAAVIV
jgi:hypothetical protein